MAHTLKNPLMFRTPRRLLATAVASCFVASSAFALPAAPTVTNGTATFNQSGSTLTVTNSNGTVINWNTFNIGAGETTRFIQPSASSSVLNRVLANDPSVIYGTLSSNGRVWLVNPAGIFVGPGGRIDAAAFIASTLNVKTEDFLAGKLNFGGNTGAGNVVNQGTITTPSGGSVYLVGPNVSNEGIIQTPQGETILAAGQTVSLIDSSTPGVKVDITGAEGNATNLGTITAEAGRIGIAGVVVRNSGTLNASSVVSEGGRIFLKASRDAYVDKAGRIVTTGTKGGRVEVLGERVAVMDQAQIDASGTSGGGQILIGGDYQGKNPDIQNAQITFFGPEASLKANATDNGDGGKVIVWADDTTRAYGTIEAKGGPNGGNGGLIETSGKRYLDVAGVSVNAGASAGKAGAWLLDPADITIDLGGVGSTTANYSPGSPGIFSYGGGSAAVVYGADIQNALISSDVIIETSGAGSGYGSISIYGGRSFSTIFGLSLLADGSGQVTGTSGNITFNQYSSLQTNSTLRMVAGWNPSGGTGSNAVYGGVGNIVINQAHVSASSIIAYAGNQLSIGGGASPGSSAYLTATGGTQTVYAGSINIVAGSGSGSYAVLASYGDQQINLTNVGGSLTLYGGGLNTDPTFGSYATIDHYGPVGNQTIQIYGGGLTLQAGAGYGTAVMNSLLPGAIYATCGTATPDPACGVPTSSNYATIHNRSGNQTIAFQTPPNTLTLQGGYSGVRNFAAISNMGSGTQAIYGSPNINMVGGYNGGSGIQSADGFHYLRNSATIFSPYAPQYLTANYISLSSVSDGALPAQSTAWIIGNGQNIQVATTIDIAAGDRLTNGGSAGIRSLAGQTITAGGAVTLTGGASGYDNIAVIEQVGNGAYSQYLNFASLTVYGGSGLGGGSYNADCPDPGCTIMNSHNSAGIYNAGSAGQSLTITGALALYGGNAGNNNKAYIQNRSSSLQAVQAGSIWLQGGDSGGANSEWMGYGSNVFGGSYLSNTASITAGGAGWINSQYYFWTGNQYISTPGSITILGNGGAGTGGMAGAAIVSTGNQSVSATGAILLRGGAGGFGPDFVGDSWARIASLGAQTISAGSLELYAGATGVGNRASVTGYGQNITIGTLLNVYGGGTGTTYGSFSNTAEIINFGGSGQSITFTGSATMTVKGGNGAGMNAGMGDSDCGIACSNLSSWNSAEVVNYSGNQTLTFTGGGTLNVIGGTAGNDNSAEIRNKTLLGTQTITGTVRPTINVTGGASGGVAVWAPSLQDYPGTTRWHDIANHAFIEAEGTQVIDALALNITGTGGTNPATITNPNGAYPTMQMYGGGAFVTAYDQTINVSGAVTMSAGAAVVASAQAGVSYPANGDSFLFLSPAIIGNDKAGHRLTINAGSFVAGGGSWSDYGASPVLVGTYQSATNTTINTTSGGISLNSANVQVGSFFASGGQVTLNAGSMPVTLTDAVIGTGSTGSTTLIGSDVQQGALGQIYTSTLNVTTTGATANLMTGVNLVDDVYFNYSSPGTAGLAFAGYGSYQAYLNANAKPSSLLFTSIDAANGAAGVLNIVKAGTAGDGWAPTGSMTSTYGGSLYLQTSGDLNATGMSFVNSYAGAYGGLSLAAGGTLTVPGISTASALSLSGGTLNVNSAITTTGASLDLFSSGTMTLAANVGATTGTTSIFGNAVTLNSGVTVGSASGAYTSLYANSLTTSGTITSAGSTYVYVPGTMTIASGGSISSGSYTSVTAGNLTTSGAAISSSGTTFVYVPGTMSMTGGSITSSGSTWVDSISLTVSGGSITSAGATYVDASITNLTNATVYGAASTSVVADALSVSSSSIGTSASPYTYVKSGGITMAYGGITSGGTTLVEGLAIDLTSSSISSYGPLTQVNAGNLVMYDGSSINAPYGNTTVNSQQNIDLNYSSWISSGYETTLNLYGSSSVLNMSWGSTVEAESPYTINLNFLGRSSGGISFQGVPLLDAKTVTDANGNGFYVLGQPAVLDTNLFITYAVSNVVDICVISPSICAPPPPATYQVVGGDDPPPPPLTGGLGTGGGSLLGDPSLTTGGETGTFGSEPGDDKGKGTDKDKDKDKDNQGDKNQGNKDGNKQQKKVVAQCRA